MDRGRSTATLSPRDTRGFDRRFDPSRSNASGATAPRAPRPAVRPLATEKPNPVKRKVTRIANATGKDPKAIGARAAASGKSAGELARGIRDRRQAATLRNSRDGAASGIASGLYSGSSFGASVGYGQGYGGGDTFHFAASYGGHPYDYGYDHCASYYGYGYHPFWYGRPVWYPWSPSPWQISHGYAFGFGYFGSGWRLSVGFGYNYAPSYYGACFYPYYRSYSYYPYSYYNTVSYYPAYSSVYHETYRVVEYVDASDPYVEFVDDVPASAPVRARPVSRVPELFLKPFVTDFPEGLSDADTLARGSEWLKDARYLYAAEAYRRGWIARPDDGFAPLQLGLALSGASEYGLASYAISEGLDRQPDTVTAAVDVRGAFNSPAVFDATQRALQRHVVLNPRDGEARFLLGYLYHSSGNDFGAHSEFTALKDGAWESPHLDPLLTESEARLLRVGK